ncbi:MAG: tetratricopeptide repeat protein, partial [Deltaproteobacteria bacterium]|nr:tetratricopeptide repeat protein [Deltaproteobacteria bacterium]
ALISSFIFLIHPIQTEAVNYVSQRFTSLATFFYLSALVCYALSRVSERGGWKKWGLYILSMVSTIAAMKTKEFSFTIPFAITAYEFIFFTGSAKSRALRLLPFYLMLPIIPLTLFAPDMGLGAGGVGIEDELRVLQLKEAAVLPRDVYSYTQLKVIARYLGMFFWPKGQTILHSPKLVHSIFEPAAFLPLALLLSLLSASAYALWRSRKSKGLYGALFSFGVFFFFIGLFIESFAVPIKQLMAERRFYLPGIGIIIGSASILMCGADHLRDKGYLNVSRTAAAFIILALSAPLLYAGLMERNRVWSDDEALLTEAIEASPVWPRLYFVRGVIYDLRNDYNRALKDYDTAVKLNPAFKDAYNNRGYLYYEAKDYGKAVEDFNRAGELAPGDYWVYFNRGLALAGLGKYKEAAGDFTTAISLKPESADAHNNRGVIYMAAGEKEKAASDLSKACSMGYESACKNLEKMKATVNSR